MVIVPEYFPNSCPSDVSRFRVAEVPVTSPAMDALVKHGESDELIVPEMVAALPPVFSPCVIVPAKWKVLPESGVKVAWKLPFRALT